MKEKNVERNYAYFKYSLLFSRFKLLNLKFKFKLLVIFKGKFF